MNDIEFGKSTRDLIKSLADRGINRMSVMMRHSARHYNWEQPREEPFLLLTEEGKEYSYNLGKSLVPGFTIKFYSSVVGRCIETAYLIDKGYVSQGGKTDHNMMEPYLSPSYVKKPFELIKVLQETSPNFIRQWFDGEISAEIIDPPRGAAQDIIGMLESKLEYLPENHINMGISHDWNLYLVKEYIMGLRHEDVGRVAYLEGLIVYQEQGKTFVVNHQSEPVEILPKK
ncbi:MAG: histidine phosphatase family protein [Proteobacteria bacterium]|nr:histidine phosphatase family protein [Pseudomonadota bacterium]